MKKRQSNYTPDLAVGVKVRSALLGEILSIISAVIAADMLFVGHKDGTFGTDDKKAFIIAAACALACLALYLMQRFVFGRVICVFGEDKLYFFDVDAKIGYREGITSGYVYYGSIKNVECDTRRKNSKVVVYGDSFSFTIENAGWILSRRLKKRIKEYSNFRGTGASDLTDKIYDGFFGELVNALENGDMRERIESFAGVRFDYCAVRDDCIELTAEPDNCGRRIDVYIDEDCMFLDVTQPGGEMMEHTEEMKNIGTLDELYSVIEDFFAGKLNDSSQL